MLYELGPGLQWGRQSGAGGGAEATPEAFCGNSGMLLPDEHTVVCTMSEFSMFYSSALKRQSEWHQHLPEWRFGPYLVSSEKSK